MFIDLSNKLLVCFVCTVITILVMCAVSALKAVETLGIRHVKGSSEYREAMRAELKKYATMNVILPAAFMCLNIQH